MKIAEQYHYVNEKLKDNIKTCISNNTGIGGLDYNCNQSLNLY